MKFYNATRFTSPVTIGAPLSVVYESEFAFTQSGEPIESSVKALAVKYEGLMVVIDIERWKLPHIPTYDKLIIDDSVAKYQKVLRWWKEAAPNSTVGYYGIIQRSYHPINQAKDPSWLINYNRVMEAISPIFDFADFIAPAGYLNYQNVDRHLDSIAVDLYRAREYGKPIYLFMWHRGTSGDFPNSELLDRMTLRRLLDMATESSMLDGIIWWSISWESDDNAANTEWYNELRRYL